MVYEIIRFLYVKNTLIPNYKIYFVLKNIYKITATLIRSNDYLYEYNNI